jgi:hypothetical protein
MESDMKNCSLSSSLLCELADMIRDEYSGDRNPRPDLLVDRIVAKMKAINK